MSIAAISNDYSTKSLVSGVVKKTASAVGETESFGQMMQAETEKKCPYSILAKDGVIRYNGVIFLCDYEQNAITLGNMYEKEKVLKIALPSGGSLHVNVDDIGTLANAASMFTPEDLNAIMRAIHEYNHCTRKRLEIEEEKAESPREAAAESETPDAEKEPETPETDLTDRIGTFRTELYYNLINKDNE